MPIVPSSPRRREVAIQTARRRIQRLEIETHRIKAELARLEADNEDDIVDELVRDYRRGGRAVVDGQIAHVEHATNGAAVLRRPSAVPVSGAPRDAASPRNSSGIHTRPAALRVDLSGRKPKEQAAASSTPTIQIAAGSPTSGTRPSTSRRWLKPAWTLSLGVHLVLLTICGLATFATLSDSQFFLLASPNELREETLDDPSEVEIEPATNEDFESQETYVENANFELGDHLLEALTPTLDSSAVDAPGSAGLTSAMPTDLGTLMAGGGEGKQGGGTVGSASFFGTRSQANRVVFVIDNSSSMKGGRLEAAVAELLRSVDAMSPKQSFYVIFVSDQPYPMFYPAPAAALLPATPPNKKLLRQWLGGLRLAGGSNRQLIKAMDLAAMLRPETVFFLWDGRIDNAGVRRDVMVHLTRPQPWDFSIHTLGMGVTAPENEQNLAAVAQAHGGTYLRVDIPARSAR